LTLKERGEVHLQRTETDEKEHEGNAAQDTARGIHRLSV
jgi:hypothetical protein